MSCTGTIESRVTARELRAWRPAYLPSQPDFGSASREEPQEDNHRHAPPAADRAPKVSRMRGSSRPTGAAGQQPSDSRPDIPDSSERLTLLTREELARDVLRVSVRELDRMRARGELPAPLRIGRSPRWTRAAIEQWIQERERAAQRAEGRL